MYVGGTVLIALKALRECVAEMLALVEAGSYSPLRALRRVKDYKYMVMVASRCLLDSSFSLFIPLAV